MIDVEVLPPASSDKEMRSFSIGSISGTIVGNNIGLTLPNGTDVTNMPAQFVATTSGAVKVGSAVQVSGSTVNDFTSPVV